MEEAQTYTSNDVAQIARVTLRQLQWWDERRLVKPVHVGHRRIYDTEDALEIAVIAELRRRKCSLHSVRKVTTSLKLRYRRWAYRVVESAAPLFLVTDGHFAHVLEGEKALDLLHSLPRQGICLSLTKLVCGLKQPSGERLLV